MGSVCVNSRQLCLGSPIRHFREDQDPRVQIQGNGILACVKLAARPALDEIKWEGIMDPWARQTPATKAAKGSVAYHVFCGGNTGSMDFVMVNI